MGGLCSRPANAGIYERKAAARVAENRRLERMQTRRFKSLEKERRLREVSEGGGQAEAGELSQLGAPILKKRNASWYAGDSVKEGIRADLVDDLMEQKNHPKGLDKGDM